MFRLLSVVKNCFMSFDVALRCLHLILVVLACSGLLILFYGLVLQIVEIVLVRFTSFRLCWAALICVVLRSFGFNCCFCVLWIVFLCFVNVLVVLSFSGVSGVLRCSRLFPVFLRCFAMWFLL